ncbi:13E12 repeat family protein [Georgenia sp. TF02-10]|uniref:DUF222 domain-containing protein n=1 Tax=Georgenia sp. TF02-10 TaxID=2917725 RepID=UPI001FA76835|nr:DUF222 domain-containing protein [Georgenia sp. TF02-10]UNX55839.1 13E12 repeat family protein [Georgenia sp. TF02-10]
MDGQAQHDASAADGGCAAMSVAGPTVEGMDGQPQRSASAATDGGRAAMSVAGPTVEGMDGQDQHDAADGGRAAMSVVGPTVAGMDGEGGRGTGEGSPVSVRVVNDAALGMFVAVTVLWSAVATAEARLAMEMAEEVGAALAAAGVADPAGPQPTAPDGEVPTLTPADHEAGGREPARQDAQAAAEQAAPAAGQAAPAAGQDDADADADGADDGGGAGAGGARSSSSVRGVFSAAAAALERTVPGPGLAQRLAGASLADADDATVVEMIAGWERLSAWVTSQQARALAELHARRTRGRPGSSIRHRGAIFEVEARLHTTQYAAEAKVGLALTLESFPAVADALTRGEIDARKAEVLCTAEPALPDADRRRVHRRVLPGAGDLTAPQLREEIRRAALEADVAAAERRHQAAYAKRRVMVEPADDTMAWVSAYLRADNAEVVRVALDALAAAAKAPGETRTLDQRRADALTDVFTGILNTGTSPAGTPLPTQHGRRPHLQVTVAAGTLLGLDDQVAELAGYGPIPADLARQIAQDATWRAMFTDAATGEFLALGTKTYRPGADLTRTIIARDVTCTFTGCRIPAGRCQIDHIAAFDHALAGLLEQTTRENLHAGCTGHHEAKTSGGWSVSRDPTTGVITWTAPTGHRYPRQPIRPPGPWRNQPHQPDQGGRDGPDPYAPDQPIPF